MLAELIRAIDVRVGDLYELTAHLVREASLLGAEEGAQRIVAERLSRLGFDVERSGPLRGDILFTSVASRWCGGAGREP